MRSHRLSQQGHAHMVVAEHQTATVMKLSGFPRGNHLAVHVNLGVLRMGERGNSLGVSAQRVESSATRSEADAVDGTWEEIAW